jgi:nicotinamidase-related amidase
LFLALSALLLFALLATAEPKADARLKVTLRDRVENKGEYKMRERAEQWDPKQTAIIICDMWDLHHCKRAVDRVKEMAPRMNEVISKAREQGVLIIHAPSSCMAPYENTPMRERARNAPRAANLPKDIGAWCQKIPSEEKGKYPIDQTDGGEDDEPKEHAEWVAYLTSLGRNPKAPWKSQIDVLKIHEQDAISDSGIEIWNLMEERGIKNVILVGVHTNMCVLGRPFGLRQMAKNGKHVVLMRDMTDTMYNPARWPHVSHFKGTELIVEHIEKYVCPTVTSDQLLGGKPFRFKEDTGS